MLTKNTLISTTALSLITAASFVIPASAVQDSIGMVPGQDPDLRAPAPRAACLREVSIQLQPQTAGSRKSTARMNVAGRTFIWFIGFPQAKYNQLETRAYFAAGSGRLANGVNMTNAT